MQSTDHPAPAWMKTIDRIVGRVAGAKGDEIVEGNLAAREAWGKAAEKPNSGITAFAYLWRRFGPPTRGSDDHKALVAYVLGTPEKDVFLWVSLSASPLSYAIGYLAREHVRKRVYRPARDWERKFERWYLADGGEATPDAFWKARMDRPTMERAIAVVGKYPVEPLQRKVGDWKKCGPEVRRVNGAIQGAMRELLRPVYVRDVPINILGTVKGDGGFAHAADPSPFSGYGVDLAPTKALMRKEKHGR